MSGFQSLVLCTNPRSGSTMLCDLLKSTGELGDPKSFYRTQSIPNWIDRLSISTDPQANPAEFEREYFEKIVIRGRAETARFSLRIMQSNLGDMIAKFRLLYPDIASDFSLIQKDVWSNQIHLSSKKQQGGTSRFIYKSSKVRALAQNSRWLRPRAVIGTRR